MAASRSPYPTLIFGDTRPTRQKKRRDDIKVAGNGNVTDIIRRPNLRGAHRERRRAASINSWYPLSNEAGSEIGMTKPESPNQCRMTDAQMTKCGPLNGQIIWTFGIRILSLIRGFGFRHSNFNLIGVITDVIIY